MAVIFQTERLRVRQYTEEDREHFFALNGNADVVQYIRPAKTREQCDAFLAEVTADATARPLYGRWAVEDKSSGGFVGSFAIIPVQGSERMQLGYALLPAHWGKGYATELTRAGLKYVFTQTPIEVIYGYTEKPNLPSQKVLLKCGFVQSGERKEGEKDIVEFLWERDKYIALHLV
jgi:[ribosomal protein S5]-alanine N-acetyltransferase